MIRSKTGTWVQWVHDKRQLKKEPPCLQNNRDVKKVILCGKTCCSGSHGGGMVKRLPWSHWLSITTDAFATCRQQWCYILYSIHFRHGSLESQYPPRRSLLGAHESAASLVIGLSDIYDSFQTPHNQQLGLMVWESKHLQHFCNFFPVVKHLSKQESPDTPTPI